MIVSLYTNDETELALCARRFQQEIRFLCMWQWAFMFILALLRAHLHNVCNKIRGSNQAAALPYQTVCNQALHSSQTAHLIAHDRSARCQSHALISTTFIDSKTDDVTFSHGCQWLRPTECSGGGYAKQAASVMYESSQVASSL